METLIFFTNLGIVLLLAVICKFFGKKYNIPDVLILLLAGVVLGMLGTVKFPALFLSSIGILALIMLIFNSVSRLKIKEMDSFQLAASKVTGLNVLLSMALLTLFTYLFFDVELSIALLFSVMIIGTCSETVYHYGKKIKNKFVEFLKIESLINTPINIVIPFLMLAFIESIKTRFSFESIFQQLSPVLIEVVTGIGCGLIVGLILVKLLIAKFSKRLSSLAVVSAALLAYILAENLGGSGILSATVMSLIFSTATIRKKKDIQETIDHFSDGVIVLVLLMLGTIVEIPLTFKFFLLSLVLFAIYIFTRYITLVWGTKTCFKKRPSIKQGLFMVLHAPKGQALAVVAFVLATYNIQALQPILGLSVLVMIYSIALTALVNKHKLHA